MLVEELTKALSDQTRLRILLLLASGDERCVCELTEALDLAQPKISRHLAVLREAGLLLDRKAGLWVYYRLHPKLPKWVDQILSGLQNGASKETLYREDAERLSCSQPAGTGCS
jgi:ArsR family transcriptional regulator